MNDFDVGFEEKQTSKLEKLSKFALVVNRGIAIAADLIVFIVASLLLYTSVRMPDNYTMTITIPTKTAVSLLVFINMILLYAISRLTLRR